MKRWQSCGKNSGGGFMKTKHHHNPHSKFRLVPVKLHIGENLLKHFIVLVCFSWSAAEDVCNGCDTQWTVDFLITFQGSPQSCLAISLNMVRGEYVCGSISGNRFSYSKARPHWWWYSAAACVLCSCCIYHIAGNFSGVQISFFSFSVYRNENLTHEM